MIYGWKNVIHFEGVDYTSNKGIPRQSLGEDVSHVMLFVYIAIVERLSSNMLTPCCTYMSSAAPGKDDGLKNQPSSESDPSITELV